MTTDIPVYYINLDSSTDRRTRIEKNLREKGITDAERIPAFDGRKIDLAEIDDCDLPAARRFLGRPLRGGEYGCYKSHMAAVNRFLETDHPYAIVLEDDIQLDECFFDIAEKAVRSLNDAGKPWDIIHLSPTRLKIFNPIEQLSDTHSLVRAYYFPQGGWALLWSREGAKNMRDHHSQVTMPVDSQFRETMTKRASGYAVLPALAGEFESDSDIDGNTGGRKTYDRLWYYGLAKQSRIWRNKITAWLRKRKFQHMD